MLVLIAYWNAYAYDKDRVHPLLNEKAALQSQNFISVLMSLGYKEQPPNDILTASYVNGRRIKEWLQEGGKDEDSGSRSLNHFHDPTKIWNQSGLKNSSFGASSLLWAQDQNSNTWSWLSAQNYYYQALTNSQKTVREKNFADTFQALGQVMHLLADASLPEHTRNDIHVFSWIDKELR